MDMMFKYVLMDGQVVDYDAYVQFLSTSQQQEGQTELYNRKLRGAPVDVGDRVLLANKEERGRRKLADRWESHLYTVVEKQENTHTFKIRNCETGQVKVVHSNIIMPVDFLPVPTEPEDCGFSVNVLTDGDVDKSVLDAGDKSVMLPECGPEDRTVSWISKLPVSTVGGKWVD